MRDRVVVILRGLRWVLGVGLVLAVPAVAHAATVTNTSDHDPGSLRDVIASSNPNDTIDFAPGLSGQTITLSGPLVIGHSLTISGPGAGSLTINGGGHGSVFDIDAAGTDNVTISGLTITGGAFTGVGFSGGGGILAENVGTLTLISDTITGNRATINSANDAGGGGVYMDGGDLAVAASTISGNTATLPGSSSGNGGGGGLYSAGGDVSVTGSNVSGNTVEIDSSTAGDNGGGGIYSAGGVVLLSADTIDGNTFTLGSDDGGDNGGAGVYSAGGGVNVFASSISGNTGNVTSGSSDNGGGGVYDAGGTSTYLVSTLSANSMTVMGAGSDNGGGAIMTFGDTTVSSVTIAGNSINQPGGAISGDATVGLKNTILADNTATPAGNCDPTFLTLTSGGFNLESANTCGLNATGDLVNTEPRLGPLQNNGGPTPTQALPVGSPAVDAGSCADAGGLTISIDQRGFPRPQPAGGRCDIGAFELQPAAAAPPAPPAAIPGIPSATSTTAASFSGSVNPNGQATTVFFQYGIDSRYRPGGGTAVIYDQITPTQTLPADSTPHAVSAAASGLVPNAVYHVRLVAQNGTGTTVGPDQTFTTPPDPQPPAPVLGQKVNAKPVSGQVFILVGTKLVPLTEAKQIPSGATLDTRAGSLQLTAAATKGHKRQTGVFGGGIFKLTQARSGLTKLSLAEGAFQGAPSFATCKAHKAAEASAAAAKTLQLLHASAHGKFRTSGRYSAATVRGTKWTIADRCDGTLVRDLTDSVLVNDFVRHRSIVLHAGQRYLAKARGRK